jgi:hypothetical protein
MKLTRRDAVAAIAAAGAVGLAGSSSDISDSPEEGKLTQLELDTLTAVARILYPTEVSNVRSFVNRFMRRRANDPSYAEGVQAAIKTLNANTSEISGGPFHTLDRDEQRAAISYLSIDVESPDPDGTAAQRIRHYIVNDLLFALYASPKGAKLAGLSNPPGHPGGIASYQAAESDRTRTD